MCAQRHCARKGRPLQRVPKARPHRLQRGLHSLSSELGADRKEYDRRCPSSEFLRQMMG